MTQLRQVKGNGINSLSRGQNARQIEEKQIPPVSCVGMTNRQYLVVSAHYPGTRAENEKQPLLRQFHLKF